MICNRAQRLIERAIEPSDKLRIPCVVQQLLYALSIFLAQRRRPGVAQVLFLLLKKLCEYFGLSLALFSKNLRKVKQEETVCVETLASPFRS